MNKSLTKKSQLLSISDSHLMITIAKEPTSNRLKMITELNFLTNIFHSNKKSLLIISKALVKAINKQSVTQSVHSFMTTFLYARGQLALLSTT